MTIDLSPTENRMDKPVLVRLSQTDRKQLQALAWRSKVPMATLAYRAVRHMLDKECRKEGSP